MNYQKLTPQPHGGVVDKEGIYFCSPSDFAKEFLYYVHFGGKYTCDSTYEIDRDYYHAFLLFRVIKGHLHFEYRGKSFVAKDGDVVFLDCKEYHHYWADDLVTFQWFHFDGCSTQGYFDLLYDTHGTCFSDLAELSFPFNYILDELKSPDPQQHKLSFLIHNIIGILALRDKKQEPAVIQKARQFIHDHYHEDITIPDIAGHVALNPFYFSKFFKKVTKMPPHQYLSHIRIQYAKTLLAETTHTLTYVAAQCGYSSDSHFIRAFKKETSVTPTHFRKYFDASGFRD